MKYGVNTLTLTPTMAIALMKVYRDDKEYTNTYTMSQLFQPVVIFISQFLTNLVKNSLLNYKPVTVLLRQEVQ